LGDHGPGALGNELIAKAAVDAPALDAVPRSIVATQIADPAAVQDLRRDAEAELSVGPWAVDRDCRAQRWRWRVDRPEIAGQGRGDAALEFMEHTRRGERLQHDIVECDGRADPDTQATERAVDVLDCKRPRRNAAKSVDQGPRHIHRVDLRSRP